METGAGAEAGARAELAAGAVRRELRRGLRECSERGLVQSAKWLAELDYALRERRADPEQEEPGAVADQEEEREAYALAKAYLDCGELDRAAHLLDSCSTPRCIFLYRYAQYLSSEKKRVDGATETGGGAGGGEAAAADSAQAQVLLDLLSYFKANRNKLDGYLLYLYGVVLRKLELRAQAAEVLVAAVRAAPVLWAAWLELATLVSSAEALEALRLPRHWMLQFFTGHVFVQLKLTEQALETYSFLASSGFEKSSYVTAQLAIAHHDKRDVDTALGLFRDLQQSDPYRLDDWDCYSHLLYLKDRRMELAGLAQRAVAIDKYRVETCCVIGNYYSLRSERQKAVIYFQRALSLDPQYLSAWILMGHEFMELQNSHAAIQCYRQAIDVNRNDYRAWNGLGQAYEILGLNGYCIYYYSRAAQLRPDDSRMLVSLGEAYEKVDKVPDALKCYYRAHSTGDIEGMALFKLAKLYERLSMSNSAAAAYTAASQEAANAGSKELPGAYGYLAHYHLRLSLLDHAAHYAYKCLEHESTKEEGKALLKSISEKRASGSAQPGACTDETPEWKGEPQPFDSGAARADPPGTPDHASTPSWPAARKSSGRYKM